VSAELEQLAEQIRRLPVAEKLTLAIGLLEQQRVELAERVVKMAHEQLELARLLRGSQP
jgi:hypothetical protein